jgi:hypothetical protein
MIPLFPYKQLVFESPLSQEEAIRRLSLEVADPRSGAQRVKANPLPFEMILGELPSPKQGLGFRFQPTLGVDHRRYSFPALRRYVSFEVNGCVQIPVVQGVAAFTNPETMMQLQFLIDPATNRTGLGTGKETVDPFDLAATPLAFVRQEGSKAAPARVGNGFGQMVVLEHPTDVEVFNLDEAEPVDNPAAGLVQEVLALVGHLLMLACQSQAGFLLAVTAFLGPAQSTLQAFQAALGLSEVARMLNLFTAGQHRKLLQPQVNADRARFLDRLFKLQLTVDRDEVLATLGSGSQSASYHWLALFQKAPTEPSVPVSVALGSLVSLCHFFAIILAFMNFTVTFLAYNNRFSFRSIIKAAHGGGSVLPAYFFFMSLSWWR